jgi:hypothetical protein
LSGGVSIANSQRVAFKRFNLDWPKTLMASIGTIVSLNTKANTMRVRIAPEYHVESSTQIIALTPWDAKSDPANPHFSLTSFYKEQYTNNTGTHYVGNNTFEILHNRNSPGRPSLNRISRCRCLPEHSTPLPSGNMPLRQTARFRKERLLCQDVHERGVVHRFEAISKPD